MSSWKSFLQSSLNENISKMGTSATYASLATITKDNKPAVRTVVIRGFVGEHYKEKTGWESDLLVIHTNIKSNKVQEIRNNNFTEINWYMNGTREQFRIGGTIDIIEKNLDPNKLSHLNSQLFQKSTNDDNQKSLALQSFLKQQQQSFWQAERLRQFIQLDSNMRAQMLTKNVSSLDIRAINDQTGWFENPQAQDFLEEAFENFVLLIVKVTSVRHWSPSTGTKCML